MTAVQQVFLVKLLVAEALAPARLSAVPELFDIRKGQIKDLIPSGIIDN